MRGKKSKNFFLHTGDTEQSRGAWKNEKGVGKKVSGAIQENRAINLRGEKAGKRKRDRYLKAKGHSPPCGEVNTKSD